MAAASAVRVNQWSTQFQSLFSDVFVVTCTIDAGAVAASAGEAETIAVPGVKLGDMVIGQSWSIDLADMVSFPYIQADGAVEIRLSADSGAGSNLGSATVKLVIARPKF